MGNTYLTEAEQRALQERRSELGAMDCSIEQKNRLITGIRDYKFVEYGMSQYGYYQVLKIKGNKIPHELTGNFTHPSYIIKLVDSLLKEGKLIEPK
ncbi:hypothetical protein [Pseudomonas sp. St316]|jgi:hypothetical protein|uniref:hypothetical protein n=1 Tax=Pseudomonas sp. St316 TaxID=2678257 RepID=UPI001BB40A46|nr:hypothetical protein [Pseudomonas sp. St316]BBP58510.1 hypothetical protein PHLH4_21000 [Pseudomonas sp. St316]